MKKLPIVLGLSILVCILGASSAVAVPKMVSYQGLLNDANGVPVSGSVSFAFALYDVPSGGTALWTENQILTVSNGVFNVQLGALQPLDPGLFVRSVLYLGIRAGADQEMAPRQRIVSASYALHADRGELWSTPIGGTGADGPYISSGAGSLTRGAAYNFTSFNLQSGHSLTATGGASNAIPLIIRVKGNASIAGTLDLRGAGMAGGGASG